MDSSVEQFIRRLKKSPEHGAAFDPWWERDEKHDTGSDAPRIRREQLDKL